MTVLLKGTLKYTQNGQRKEETEIYTQKDFISFVLKFVKRNVYAHIYVTDLKRDGSHVVGVCMLFSHTLKNVLMEYEGAVISRNLNQLLSYVLENSKKYSVVAPMQILYYKRDFSAFGYFLLANYQWDKYSTSIPKCYESVVQKEISTFYNTIHPSFLCYKCLDAATKRAIDYASELALQYQQNFDVSLELNREVANANYRPFHVNVRPCAALSAYVIGRMVDKLVFTPRFFGSMCDDACITHFNAMHAARLLLSEAEFTDFKAYRVFKDLINPNFYFSVDYAAFKLLPDVNADVYEKFAAVFKEFFEIVRRDYFLEEFNKYKDKADVVVYLLYHHGDQLITLLNRIYANDGMPPFTVKSLSQNYRMLQSIYLATFMQGIINYIIQNFAYLRPVLEPLTVKVEPDAVVEYDECPIDLLNSARIALQKAVVAAESTSDNNGVSMYTHLEDEQLTTRNKQAFYQQCYARMRAPYYAEVPRLQYNIGFIYKEFSTYGSMVDDIKQTYAVYLVQIDV